MNAIVAISQNNIIGYQDGSLIDKPSFDMKFFKMMTSFDNDNTVIMGRKTWETFNNKLLPNRRHIVISKNIKNTSENPELLNVVKDLDNYNFNNCWLIGGAQIYKSYLDKCDGIFITRTKTIAPEENAVYFPFNDFELDYIFPNHVLISETPDYTIEYYSKFNMLITHKYGLKNIAFMFANNNLTEGKASYVYENYKEIAKAYKYGNAIVDVHIGWAALSNWKDIIKLDVYTLPHMRKLGFGTRFAEGLLKRITTKCTIAVSTGTPERFTFYKTLFLFAGGWKLIKNDGNLCYYTNS